MKNISAISNPHTIQDPLPTRSIRITLYKVTEKKPLEDLKKALSLGQCWIDGCLLSPDDFRMQLRREKRRVDRSSAPLSMERDWTIMLIRLKRKMATVSYL